MEKWQFNVLFFVGVGGAILLLIGEDIGLQVSHNPTAITGIGAILTYVLTQKKNPLTRNHDKKTDQSEDDKSIDKEVGDGVQ